MLKVKVDCGMMLNMSLWAAAWRLLHRFEIGYYLRPNYVLTLTKTRKHPDFLKQLALETIYKIPDDALQIYTDGNKGDGASSDSAVFIKKGECH
ncbi:hypothetical protein CEXT_716381 [Caerostris extrusa]|uniref:Uncharacterized protein n=1 Tax=Caerostris extrusa TaxID=172846 RepID=A0AAV4S4C2_CAEEX|nr:hypothetical protein CEXT_716381 [Caerostris extrusa]